MITGIALFLVVASFLAGYLFVIMNSNIQYNSGFYELNVAGEIWSYYDKTNDPFNFN